MHGGQRKRARENATTPSPRRRRLDIGARLFEGVDDMDKLRFEASEHARLHIEVLQD